MGNLPIPGARDPKLENRSANEESETLTNTLNELQILSGHKDIVRILLKIDSNRIASASDDGSIIIWNFTTGQKLLQLTGHTLPITCLLQLDRHTLVSGSSDKTIRIWNCHTGACENVISPAHSGSVQCLAKLEGSDGNSLFCSGGNDRKLFIWRGDSQKPVGSIKRHEEENLHCLLPISNNRLVTGSNSAFLFVYNTDTLTFNRLLAYHRESVRCLKSISDSLFASGSLDGSVVVWQAESLTPLKILNFPEKYFENHVYSFCVNHLMTLGEKFLAVAIGNSFRVYDVMSGDCVMDCQGAHEATVLYLISLYNSTRIVSCSADSSIKLWAPTQVLKTGLNVSPLHYNNKDISGLYGTTNQTPTSSTRFQSRFSKPKPTPAQAVCLGEMWGHTEAVHCLEQLDYSSFASCGSDKLVVLWKDGEEQSELRNRAAFTNLMQWRSTDDSTDTDTSFEEFEGKWAKLDDDDEYNSDPSITNKGRSRTFSGYRHRSNSGGGRRGSFGGVSHSKDFDDDSRPRRSNYSVQAQPDSSDHTSPSKPSFSDNSSTSPSSSPIHNNNNSHESNLNSIHVVVSSPSIDSDSPKPLPSSPIPVAVSSPNSNLPTLSPMALAVGLEMEASAEHRKLSNSQGGDEKNMDKDYDDKPAFSKPVLSSSRHAAPVSLLAKRETPKRALPDYIFDHAEMLRKEKKYSMEKIMEELRGQGHSEPIVNAYVAKVNEISAHGSQVNSSDS